MQKSYNVGEKNPMYRKTRELCPSYKGGRLKAYNGYIYILLPEHHLAKKDGYVLEHSLIAEQHIGRLLSKIEVVHHINGIRDYNRIDNLRWATIQENCMNRSKKSTNKSGLIGVSFDKKSGKFRPQIKVNGKNIMAFHKLPCFL